MVTNYGQCSAVQPPTDCKPGPAGRCPSPAVRFTSLRRIGEPYSGWRHSDPVCSRHRDGEDSYLWDPAIHA